MQALSPKYETALRVLGRKPGVALTDDQVKDGLKRDSLKILQNPQLSDAYKVLLKYNKVETPRKRLPPTNWAIEIPAAPEALPTTPATPSKLRRTNSALVADIEQKPITKLFASIDRELSRLAHSTWAMDLEWTKDSSVGSDVYDRQYEGSAFLEDIRGKIERDAKTALSPGSLASVLALSNGMISARWVWMAAKGVPDLMIKQNVEEAATLVARKVTFTDTYASAITRGKMRSGDLPPKPESELDVICIDLVVLFCALDKILAGSALIRRQGMSGMLLENVGPTIQALTGIELTSSLLGHLLAIGNDKVEARWVRPSFNVPAKLEILQRGVDQETLIKGRARQGDRVAEFKAAVASAKSSGILPSVELPSYPAGTVE